MVGADESTELWRHPTIFSVCLPIIVLSKCLYSNFLGYYDFFAFSSFPIAFMSYNAFLSFYVSLMLPLSFSLLLTRLYVFHLSFLLFLKCFVMGQTRLFFIFILFPHHKDK